MSKTPMISKPLKKRQRNVPASETTSAADEFVSGAAVATSPAIVRTSDKPAKLKLVRKSFSFTETELKQIEDVKLNLLIAGRERGEPTSLFDNEIVRLGLVALAEMSTEDILALVEKLPRAR